VPEVRYFLVVLVACGGSAATPAPAPLTGRSVAPAVAPSSQAHARIAVGTTSWIEVSTTGTPAESQAHCKQVVDSVIVVGGRRVLRDCAAVELPPPPWTSPVLVTIDDELSIYQPYDDLDACRRARDQLDADEDRAFRELERTRIADLLERRNAAQLDEVAACTEMHDALEPCGRLHDSARTQCLLEAQPKKVACDEMTRRRTLLEAQRSVRPHPSRRRYACQDR
jgi:hypothetical protein